MNALRFASISLSLILLTALRPPPARAVPHPNPAPAGALSFDVSASLGYQVNGAAQTPSQNFQVKVYLLGGKTRIEATLVGEPSVILYSPPYVYRLLPSAKAGLRWTIAPQPAGARDVPDFQALIRDPKNLRAALVHLGGKQVGTGVLDGSPVEIYEIENFHLTGTTLRVWLRSADALPLMAKTTGGSFRFAATWKNYRRTALPAPWFAPPPDYHVREVSGPPPFALL